METAMHTTQNEANTVLKALTVRGVDIRKADGTLMPIGKAAEAAGIDNPAKMAKDFGANPSDDQKLALVKAKANWKLYSGEYNRAREEAFKHNDILAGIIQKQQQARGIRVLRNKSGDVTGYNVQYRPTNPQSELDRLKKELEELRAFKAASLSAKPVEATPAQ